MNIPQRALYQMCKYMSILVLFFHNNVIISHIGGQTDVLPAIFICTYLSLTPWSKVNSILKILFAFNTKIFANYTFLYTAAITHFFNTCKSTLLAAIFPRLEDFM